MCQETFYGGLYKELDSFGYMSEIVQEKRRIFYSVVVDGIYFYYEYVFGYNLGRKKRLYDRFDFGVFFLCGWRGVKCV